MATEPRGPRVLTIDIETAPATADVWTMFGAFVSLDQLKAAQRVICWAAKWHDRSQVMFASEYHDGHDTMVARAHELMSEADVLVHYNGKRFDVPHLHREFVLADLAPPAPHKDVDLLAVARGRFKFTSNKLDHVAQQLGVGAKVQHEGHRLWRDCLDPTVDADVKRRAWDRMRRYNKGDVKITEALYDKLRPWIRGHPNIALYDGTAGDQVEACGRCGSTHKQRRGWYYTDVSVYPKYQCQGCMGWSRGKRRTVGVNVRPVT